VVENTSPDVPSFKNTSPLFLLSTERESTYQALPYHRKLKNSRRKDLIELAELHEISFKLEEPVLTQVPASIV
jgi:hypothetical protein